MGARWRGCYEFYCAHMLHTSSLTRIQKETALVGRFPVLLSQGCHARPRNTTGSLVAALRRHVLVASGVASDGADPADRTAVVSGRQRHGPGVHGRVAPHVGARIKDADHPGV